MLLEDVKVGPIFSPYPTTSFQRCPRAWDLGRRWQGKGFEGKTAMLVGTAVALGLELHLTGSTKEAALEAARAHVEANYVEDSDRSRDGVQTLVRRGTRHGMETNLGLGEILGVEKFYGRTKPDLVGRSLDGRVVVVDHKVKLSLDDKYKEKELLKFETNNQMFHYAWTVAQELGEPVATVYIHLIVLAPRVYTAMHPIPIDQEHLAYWLEGVAKDWQEMAAIEAGKFPARPRFSACMDPWPCDFRDACHVLKGDERTFRVLYDIKPARKY